MVDLGELGEGWFQADYSWGHIWIEASLCGAQRWGACAPDVAAGALRNGCYQW